MGARREVFVNARFLVQTLTGVQRYGAEMVKALDRLVEEGTADPGERRPVLLAQKGARGDGLGLKRIPVREVGRLGGAPWIQLELPYHARGRVLWTPGNVGPVYHRPHVVTIHDAATLDHPEWFSPRFAAYYRFLLPKLAKNAARLLTVSEFTRERLVDRLGLDPARISVVPNGVDPKFGPLPAGATAPVLQRLGLPRDYVLALGSLEPRKNLAGLLRAWSLLLARGGVPREAHLVVVGGTSSALYRDAGLLPLPKRVTLAGYVADEDLPAVYSGALAFAYPSFYEGFGLPPLEAMACAVPVVTSGIPAIREVVGDAALLVDPHDDESIAEGLGRMLDAAGLRASLRAAGPERAKLFDWEGPARSLWGHLIEADGGSRS